MTDKHYAGSAWILGLILAMPVYGLTGDVYFSPEGGGDRTGSSAVNTQTAQGQALQQAWDNAAAGTTVWLTSGKYHDLRLSIQQKGTPGKIKVLRGLDTGGGLPAIACDFDRSRPSKTGGTFIKASNSSYWQVADMEVSGYAVVIHVSGSVENIAVDNLSISNVREGLRMEGLARAKITNCRINGYTKRGIRFIEAGPDILIRDCLADAGGRDWATEPFHMGFSVESTTAEVSLKDCLTFDGCTARNNYHDGGSKYWNGDGFCSERKAKAVKYLNCRAFDNTDGGWDDKAEEIVFRDCIAIGNKRNFRCWSNADMSNCVSAYATYRGGSGGAAGLWSSGRVVICLSTFYENPAVISLEDSGSVTFDRCLVSLPDSSKTNADDLKAMPNATFKETTVCGKGSNEVSPGFIAPVREWDGTGSAFDSRHFGDQRGYHSKRDKDISDKERHIRKDPDIGRD